MHPVQYVCSISFVVQAWHMLDICLFVFCSFVKWAGTKVQWHNVRQVQVEKDADLLDAENVGLRSSCICCSFRWKEAAISSRPCSPVATPTFVSNLPSTQTTGLTQAGARVSARGCLGHAVSHRNWFPPNRWAQARDTRQPRRKQSLDFCIFHANENLICFPLF